MQAGPPCLPLLEVRCTAHMHCSTLQGVPHFLNSIKLDFQSRPKLEGYPHSNPLEGLLYRHQQISPLLMPGCRLSFVTWNNILRGTHLNLQVQAHVHQGKVFARAAT